MHSNVSCMFLVSAAAAALVKGGVGVSVGSAGGGALDHHGLHPQSIFICILNVVVGSSVSS